MSFWNKLGHFFGDVVPNKGNADNSDSTWNHNNGYNVDSTAETAEQLSGSGIDPFGLISGLYNDITGVSAQQREFSQQEYLQDKQNEYNKPVNQMKRMIDAGINPNTAASAISQGGNESAQAPAVSSNTSGGSQGLSALGAAAGAVTGGIGSLASAGLAAAQAGEIGALLEFKKNQFAAEIAKTWIDAGMDSHMATYWSVKAAYADKNERLDIAQKSWAINKSRQEIRKLKEDVRYRQKEIELIKHQISSAEYKAKMDEIDLYFQDERKKLYDEIGVDITLPENAMLIQADEAGTLDEVAAAFGKGAYSSSHAAYEAEIDTIEERVKKEYEAKYSFEQKIKRLEANKDFTMDLYKNVTEFFGGGDRSPQSLVRLVLSMLASYSTE